MESNLNLIKMVENDLTSDDCIAQIYAIRACCIKELSTPKIIESLKKLTKSKKHAMWQNISDAATAALDILGVEKYNGNNPVIKEMIRTKNYSINNETR